MLPMMNLRKFKRRGFSLVELAIVLGVVGTVIGGVWGAAGVARQSSRLEQASENVSLSINAVRSVYGSQSAIVGSVAQVEPLMIQVGGMPTHLLRNFTTSCNGITNYFADTPWPGTADVCGTLRLCAWPAGISAGGAQTVPYCSNVASNTMAQFFAVEFTQLSYGSCVSLAQRLSPSSSAGLRDIYINGYSAVATGSGLPVTPSLAANVAPYVGKGCVTGSNANVIDFVYSLRVPIT